MVLLAAALLATAAVLAVVAWKALGSFCASIVDLPFVVTEMVMGLVELAALLASRRGKPRFPEWSLQLDVVQTLTHRLLTKFGANVTLATNAKQIRRQLDVLSRPDALESCKAHSTTVETAAVNGLDHLWLRGDTPANAERFVVLYVHGGGYTLGSYWAYVEYMNRLRADVIQRLEREATNPPIQLDVLFANYRKAPDVQFPVPQQDVLRVFQHLRDHEGVPPGRILLAGDSAGGGLVLSTLLRLKHEREKPTMPLAAVLFFPWCDFDDDGADPRRGENCVLARPFLEACKKALMPKAEDKSTWEDASAVTCDLSGLPPAIVQVGSADYVYQDSLKLIKQAQDCGVAGWELDVSKNVPHGFCFMAPSTVPEAAVAITRISGFLAKRMQSAVQ